MAPRLRCHGPAHSQRRGPELRESAGSYPPPRVLRQPRSAPRGPHPRAPPPFDAPPDPGALRRVRDASGGRAARHPLLAHAQERAVARQARQAGF
eukprot:448302-Rhodomonas_salina.1